MLDAIGNLHPYEDGARGRAEVELVDLEDAHLLVGAAQAHAGPLLRHNMLKGSLARNLGRTIHAKALADKGGVFSRTLLPWCPDDELIRLIRKATLAEELLIWEELDGVQYVPGMARGVRFKPRAGLEHKVLQNAIHNRVTALAHGPIRATDAKPSKELRKQIWRLLAKRQLL